MLVCGVAIATTACSSDRSYSPPGTVLTNTRVSEDVAVTAGMTAAASIDDQAQYLDNSAVSPACSYAAMSGLWTCASFINSHGLTVLRSYQYFDQAGHAMQFYDSLATEWIEYKSQSDGEIGDGTAVSGMTHRTGEQTLSGLLGRETTRAWDGAGVSADTTSYHDASGTRRYAGVQLDSVKKVIYAQPRRPGSYPLSGQIVRVANYLVTAVGDESETRSVSRTVVTTFNGTSAVPIRLGTVSCTLHLDTRAVDGCTGN